MIKGKVWGNTEELLVTPLIEIHRINIAPHSQCSTHKHEHKWNMFYVVTGTIDIVVEKNDYNLTDVTHLYDDEYTSVKPNEFHRFENNSDDWAQVLEIYYLEPITEDIVRRNCGSVGAAKQELLQE